MGNLEKMKIKAKIGIQNGRLESGKLFSSQYSQYSQKQKTK
jgi:hypothetical protein